MSTHGRARRALVPLLLVASGCSLGDPFPPLHPLTGTVTRDGKPVTGGGLIFISESETGSALIVNAAVARDGTFAARTEHTGRSETTIRPGAPVGRYKVVYHPPGDGSKMGLEVALEQAVTVEGKSNEAALLLPSKMPAVTGAVRDGKPAAPAEGQP